jgi:hypothetical protein
MADIYSNRYVSLAASLSANSRGGSFARQGRGSCRVGVVHCPSGLSLPLHMRLKPPHYPTYPRYFPLASRGWVLQETLLSPRILHFIDLEVMFECLESVECECGAADNFTNSKSDHRFTMGDSAWQNIVSRFTRTSLTFDRDTLPALSGLAQKHLSDNPTTYIWPDYGVQLFWKTFYGA